VTDNDISSSNEPKPANPERRAFMKKATACALGGAVAGIPIAAGVAVYTDPLRRENAKGEFIRITSMDNLAMDGTPKKFTVYSNRKDIWTTFPKSPIGAVYISRNTDDTLRVLNVICPHAGCFVEHMVDNKVFFCPCHTSIFTLEGDPLDGDSPSPRPLDELRYEVRNGGEVWIEFMNFVPGEAKKIIA
jgi:menaquinol-cytochrome c reductase iron-sulfur subunit